MVLYVDQPHAVLVQARRLGQAGAGPRRRASRRSRRTTRRSRSTSRRASSTRRRSTARSRPRTSSTPSSAPSPRRSRAATPGTYFSSIVGTPDEAEHGRHQADLGHRDARRHTRSSSSSRRRSAPLVSQALVMPITVPVPEGVRDEVRRKHPSKYDQYVAFTGPYMVKNDPRPASSTGRVAGQVDRHRPQPQLGQVDRLPPRLPRRDQHRGGQRRPGDRRRAAR